MKRRRISAWLRVAASAGIAAVAASVAMPRSATPQAAPPQMQTGADLRNLCRDPGNPEALARCAGFLGEMFDMLTAVAPLCPGPAPDLRGIYLRYTLAHPEYLAVGRSIAVTNAFAEAFPC